MTREKWKKLTEEEQRIKVAELCGWVYDGKRVAATGRPAESIWMREGKWGRMFEMPDYIYDLNAMHEAEDLVFAHIHSEVGEQYSLKLVEICAGSERESIRATAAQRAEAFVLTMDGE